MNFNFFGARKNPAPPHLPNWLIGKPPNQIQINNTEHKIKITN